MGLENAEPLAATRGQDEAYGSSKSIIHSGCFCFNSCFSADDDFRIVRLSFNTPIKASAAETSYPATF